jgi:hypothetical protein
MFLVTRNAAYLVTDFPLPIQAKAQTKGLSQVVEAAFPSRRLAFANFFWRMAASALPSKSRQCRWRVWRVSGDAV